MLMFENEAAVMAYCKIRMLGIWINAPEEMVFTEKEMMECIADIEKRNYGGKKISDFTGMPEVFGSKGVS